MNRKEFLTKATGTAIALSTVSLTGLFTSPSCKSRPKGSISASDLEPAISEELNKRFKALMKWVIENGWMGYLHNTTNLSIDKYDTIGKIEAINNKTSDHLQFTVLIKDMKAPDGFDDFAGSRLIEPGMPQLSLLYHALASPRVRPAAFTSANYPSVEQLDTLENYIYALRKFTIPESDLKKEYCFAVFAYEYRPAFKTPHHMHADMVYSRTGIARIGEREMNYDRMNRCWTNLPAIVPGTTVKNIAVTPARYGVFLARKVTYDNIHLLSMGKYKGEKNGDDRYDNFHDDKKWFLQPVRKIFDNDLLINEKALSFIEKHESRKIYNLIKPNDESLIRKSADLIEQDKSKTMTGSSFLVISRCSNESGPALVRPAKKSNAQVYIRVTDHSRYFTSYNQEVVEDIEILDEQGRYRGVNGYQFGRNKPMYVNITYKRDDSNKTGFTALKRAANGAFETEIYKGGYETPLFEDSICDGYLTVDTSGWDGHLMQGIGRKNCIPAFSIVTAPDFFPQVDNFDLAEFDVGPGTNSKNESSFYEGGVASLATIRISPDPKLIRNEMPDGKSVDETYTAVYCEKNTSGFDGKKSFSDPRTPKGYFVSGYLPDVSSSVFAPGWDITYSNYDSTNKPENVFLSTRGLGSPFVEDMKLCAASNGMWPAASPDASRTYQGSVTNKEFNIDEWLRNPTAIPLLDEEIGIHKDSPCTDQSKKGSLGWDGEQGPFLQMHDNKWYVNFTDLGRADYVDNALHQRVDASKLRELTSLELITRMSCLKKCIRDATNMFHLDGGSDLWLVSAEKIDWGKQKQFDAHGIPDKLKGNDKDWAKNISKNIDQKESCYLFVFADTNKDADEKQKNNSWVDEGNGFVKRRRQQCKKSYVYQVTISTIERLM